MKFLRSLIVAVSCALLLCSGLVPQPVQAVTYTILFSNNAASTLATGISSSSPSLQAVSGGGALFPAVGTNQAFIATLISQSNPNIREVVLVTGRSGDNFTGLVRNYGGGGSALSWSAGDIVALLQPAQAMQAFAQFPDLQAQTTNWALDIGAANAYVVHLTPALNASTRGMPIRWFAAHTNTGASTFNDGIIQAPLVRLDGGALLPVDVVGGSFYESVWNGAVFILYNVRDVSFPSVLGTIGNGQVPSSAVTQWQAALAIAFSQLTSTITSGQLSSSLALPGSPTTTTQSAGDSSTKVATTAFANPGVVTNGNGTCIKFASGYQIEMGVVNPNGGTAHITYPCAFSTIAVPVVVSTASGPVQTWLVTGTASLSGVTVGNSGGTSNWLALGQ